MFCRVKTAFLREEAQHLKLLGLLKTKASRDKKRAAAKKTMRKTVGGRK